MWAIGLVRFFEMPQLGKRPWQKYEFLHKNSTEPRASHRWMRHGKFSADQLFDRTDDMDGITTPYVNLEEPIH